MAKTGGKTQIAVEIPVMTKPSKELQAMVTKTKRTTTTVAEKRWPVVRKRPAVKSESEDETDGETEGETEAETEEELPKPKRIERPKGSTNKKPTIIKTEREPANTTTIHKPKKRVAFRPIDLNPPTSPGSNRSLDSPALQILRNLGHQVRAGAPSPQTPAFSQRSTFDETLSSMTYGLPTPSTIQTKSRPQKRRVLCPPEDLPICKPKTNVKFDLSLPVKTRPKKEGEAKVKKATKPNNQLVANISKATKNMMANLNLGQKAPGGVSPLRAPLGHHGGAKKPRGDACDVSSTFARELADQFVQALELNPSLEMVLDSTAAPGFERGTEEREMLAPPRHREGVKKPEDHVDSPVSPLTHASKFLHDLDLSPSLPMVPHNTPQNENGVDRIRGEQCIDLTTPIQAVSPAIKVLRDPPLRGSSPLSSPSPTPMLHQSPTSPTQEQEAALFLLTHLRDLDEALGEAKAICNLLVPAYSEMERPLSMPRSVKCLIRGLERRIRKCREFYLGELVGIVERAAGSSVERVGEKEGPLAGQAVEAKEEKEEKEEGKDVCWQR